MPQIDVDYVRPCVTTQIRDDFADHKARGSVLPGLDYACNTGDKCFATANGVVTMADTAPNDVRGISLVIKHRDGNESHYLHLSKLFVNLGDKVKMGDKIALTGNTGTTTTGAHLHFAIRNNKGVCIDPAVLLKNEAIEAKLEAKAAKKTETN